MVGRKHYTDNGMLTLDARRSAQAVRGILDSAAAELRDIIDAGGSMLGRPVSRRPQRVG